MIVEQVEAFKIWLTAVLKPMCEADPAALAKYVLALIKKDKTEEELRKTMVSQLDVFLNETESFVNLVFQTLASKEYITSPIIPNANPPNPIGLKPAKESTKQNKVIVSPSELPSLSENLNGGAAPAAVPAADAAPPVAKKDVDVKKDPVKDARKNSENEKEDKNRRRSRYRSSSRERARSRSRSRERIKRSRSKDKSRERDQHRPLDREKRDRPRIWRNKSPPRRYDRRRSRSNSPLRLRSRSRSPRYIRGRPASRYRNRNSNSRSRSRSLEPKRDRKDTNKDKEPNKDLHSRPGTPTQDSNHGDMDLRLTNTTQSIQSVVIPQINKRRCRDFDEKGYCMSGEMCPFDHGVDPVVLEDTVLTRVLNYNPNGTPMDGGNSGLPAPMINGPGHPIMGPRGIPPEYNPQAPQMWNRGMFRGPRPMGPIRMPPNCNFPPPNMQRELIPVPVMDDKKKGFDFNRLGPRSKNTTNCSLELKKVPQGLNSITHLNNHFSKFGKIVNIQVQFEGDPEAAIVTFSSHAEANAAYRSTEAVLNNRFIKVFWHNGGPVGSEGNQDHGMPQRSIKERLGMGAGNLPPGSNKIVNIIPPRVDSTQDNNNVKKDVVTSTTPAVVPPEVSKAQVNAAIRKNQELLAAKEKLKKNQDEKRKEVIKINNDLQKRKHELLEKQLSQQRVLIEKMEKMPPGPHRDLIKDTIKKTQESIEVIKKDLEQAALAAKAAPPHKKSREEAEKEMLDAELDLITKQQEGSDTSEIQRKLIELRERVGVNRAIRGRPTRRFNPIVSRHLLSKNNLIFDKTRLKNNLTKTQNSIHKLTVDHRPTKLLVSGYETDEQTSVLNHFQQYGNVVDYTIDDTLPSIVLNYKTRKEAEVALLKGKNFQDRTLSITWCNNVQTNNQRNARPANKNVLLSETEEDQLMIDQSLLDQSLLEGEEELGPEISEEVLLQDDEEEDDESEDRSWRR